MKKRIAVLVSGGGTNLQALLEAEAAGKIPHGEIAMVVSNNPNAYALERAKNFGVPAAVINKKEPSSFLLITAAGTPKFFARSRA